MALTSVPGGEPVEHDDFTDQLRASLEVVPRERCSADQWAERIRSRMGNAVEAIVATGRDLADAKADLGHGGFEDMVRDQLGMDPSTAQRLMAVARNPVLANPAHVQLLPASWGTLYELSRLPERAAVAAIEAGEIRPDMERKEAERLRARYVPVEPTRKAKAAPSPVDDTDGQGDEPPAVEGPPFSTIVADPPWRYDNSATRGAAEDHYPTMTVEELCKLGVEDWAADDAHLYLWTTNAFLREAFEVMDAWGFTYKGLLVWVKPQMGMGNYFRVSSEYVLFGIRGSLPTQRNDVRNWFEAPRGKHSAKPDSFFDLVESASPGPYLEMFARRRRLGWSVWGDEA